MILVISESRWGIRAIPQSTAGVSQYVGIDIRGVVSNNALPCFSVSFIFHGHALFKMSLGKRLEKLAALGVPCVYPLCVSSEGHVCIWGMVHRFEGVALIFHAGLCALSFVSNIKAIVTYVLGT